MKNDLMTAQADPIDAALAVGLKDLWFPICPSGFVQSSPVSLRRLAIRSRFGATPAARSTPWKTTARTAARRCRSE